MERERVAVLVPRRIGDEHRERAWAHVRHGLHADGWRVYQGWHFEHEGPFNRSLAINRAAEAADTEAAQRGRPRWEAAVVLDGDTIVASAQIAGAVALAEGTGAIAFGFHRYAALDEAGTRKVLDGFDGDWEPFVAYEFEDTASSCVVVTRGLWDAVGGFDAGFVGWGFEDVAFSLACQAIAGPRHRHAGTAWHLWHPPAPHAADERSPVYKANQARCARYIDAAGPEAMRTLLEELR